MPPSSCEYDSLPGSVPFRHPIGYPIGYASALDALGIPQRQIVRASDPGLKDGRTNVGKHGSDAGRARLAVCRAVGAGVHAAGIISPLSSPENSEGSGTEAGTYTAVCIRTTGHFRSSSHFGPGNKGHGAVD
jgi:hypothetical protein